MEKPSSGKVLLDDTVTLTAVIEASQNAQSHTVSVGRKESFMCERPGWSCPRRRCRGPQPPFPSIAIRLGLSAFWTDDRPSVTQRETF